MEGNKNHEEYINIVSQLNQNIYVIGEYINKQTKILHKCKICKYEWKVSPYNVLKGHGCPVCYGNVILKGYNDLATTHPDIVSEWNYKKNNDILPTQVSCGSNKVVWWICKQGHEWTYPVYKKVYGYGCPYCSGRRVMIGFNDLQTTNSSLSDEWNYEKNEHLTPLDVTAHSSKKVWWICKKCGHEWESVIANRSKGSGCPSCARSKRFSIPEGKVYYYVKKYFSDAIPQYKDLSKGLTEIDIYIYQV